MLKNAQNIFHIKYFCYREVFGMILYLFSCLHIIIFVEPLLNTLLIEALNLDDLMWVKALKYLFDSHIPPKLNIILQSILPLGFTNPEVDLVPPSASPSRPYDVYGHTRCTVTAADFQVLALQPKATQHVVLYTLPIRVFDATWRMVSCLGVWFFLGVWSRS